MGRDKKRVSFMRFAEEERPEFLTRGPNARNKLMAILGLYIKAFFLTRKRNIFCPPVDRKWMPVALKTPWLHTLMGVL